MEELENYFKSDAGHPQHISVGGILVNEKNEICCHQFTPEFLKEYWNHAPENIHTDAYLLMRETIHPHETLESGLHRGLMEEFGATAELLDYAGSIVAYFKLKGQETQKTTLYFLARLISIDLAKRDLSDIEGKTIIEWHTAQFLVPRMKAQGAGYGRSDVDESSILERLLEQGKL
jgi:hypothetical protein